MTQKEKAERYDEAIERARNYYSTTDSVADAELIELIFPELKESEDEKIRKTLIDYFKTYKKQEEFGIKTFFGIPTDDILAWLEKQGEKKPTIEMITPEESLGITPEEWNEIENECIFGEDKPKFKVGDWVVYKNEYYKVIDNKHELEYILEDAEGKTKYVDVVILDDKAHDFTIADAKDGDVLAIDLIEGYSSSFVAIYKKQTEEDFGDFDSYCFVGFDGKFYEGEEGHSTEDVHPATKEQRDTLERTMANAGYKWNAEKKELKEIIDKEQIKKNLQDNSFRRMFEQKCSEDDSVRLQRIIDFLWYNRKGDTDTIYQQEQDIDWLKSLKDVVQPNPSWSEEDERMYRKLHNLIYSTQYCDSRKELSDWLKSLKEKIGK